MPVVGPECEVEPQTPAVRDLAIARQHPRHASSQWEQVPEIDATRRTQGFDGAPFDLHAIWVKKNDRAVFSPVSVFAPLLQQRVGIAVMKRTARQSRREIRLHDLLKSRHAGLGLFNERIVVEWVRQLQRDPGATVAEAAGLLIDVVKHSGRAGGNRLVPGARAGEGIDVPGAEMLGLFVVGENRPVGSQVLAKPLKFLFRPVPTENVLVHRPTIRLLARGGPDGPS